MTEGVWIAIIGLLQGALVALFARQSSRQKRADGRLSRIERDASAARAQVENDHGETPNFREDADGKHAELLGKIETMIATQKDHGGAIIGIRKDMRHLREVDLDTQRSVTASRQDTAALEKKLDEHLDWSRTWVAERQKDTP